MVVEFIGGSLNGQIRTILRFFDYMNTDSGEVYNARAVQYKNLNWIYVWYEFQGNPLQNPPQDPSQNPPQGGHEIYQ